MAWEEMILCVFLRLHDSADPIRYTATLPLIKARHFFPQPSHPELTAVHGVLQETEQRLRQQWLSGTWWVLCQETMVTE
eukprot:s524_g3.t1